MLCIFWFSNVLRATAACTFSTFQCLKVLRSWGALRVLTWKCASRHNGEQFSMSHLTTWLRTRRFSEPTFRPSGATNHWKNKVLHDFSTFSRTCIFCLLTLSLFWSSFFFSSLILPTSAFSSVHIVGSLTSKLPSIIYNYFNCHRWLPALKQVRSQNIKLPASAQALQWPPSSYPSQPTFVHENVENTAVICCRLKILLVTQGPLQPVGVGSSHPTEMTKIPPAFQLETYLLHEFHSIYLGHASESVEFLCEVWKLLKIPRIS